ncbi:hypothetical protein [Novacetimonas maltaceti]|uniref:hypothetical protein n=1 Tax=Novacetimonas maltaceti TaxID=1203393 RepID=UPI0011B469F8|nr:hypothetical protein [Novacetimonas maltaceti]
MAHTVSSNAAEEMQNANTAGPGCSTGRQPDTPDLTAIQLRFHTLIWFFIPDTSSIIWITIKLPPASGNATQQDEALKLTMFIFIRCRARHLTERHDYSDP